MVPEWDIDSLRGTVLPVNLDPVTLAVVSESGLAEPVNHLLP